MDIKRINSVLKEQLALINPSKEEMLQLREETNKLVSFLEKNIKKNKIKAQVFIGGSFAKGTIIKKDKYDVDIFVRFDLNYDEEKIGKMLNKIVPKDSCRLHGSRDYFSIKITNAEFEIIPVVNIKKARDARNITDLSYFHVNYIKNKISKNKKLSDEIKIAKSFIHSAECYGAESYINGFSGYAVELLLVHYKSLVNFINNIVKGNLKEKIIIDDEKQYKNKQEILRNMNEAKLHSPIILVDPTFKERNALSALSLSSFIRFRDFCLNFLKNPSADFFRIKNKEEEFNKRYKDKTVKIQLKTNKQAGDIAGTKLKKFYRFFIFNLNRFFDVKASDFIYDEKENIGKILLVCEEKKEIIFPGPPIKMEDQFSRFKKEHNNIEIIKGKSFAYEKSISFQEWFDEFKCKDERFIESMDISNINLL